jgi:alkylation response protein AidB-like acyl-CoA dehydrogenase
MTPESVYAAADRLERHLGDPAQGDAIVSWEACVAHDERDEFPEGMVRALDDARVHHYYVPAEVGGSIRSYEEVLSVLRVVSRRDLTLAIAHAKSYLGAVAVWVAGTPAQRSEAASLILSGRQMALALTERAHGGDLLSCDVRADPVAGGFQLSGQKWLVNNATRGSALTLFARTDAKGGPRGFSLFLVNKSALPAGSYSHVPKILTHGIRGADISGIRFEGATIDRGSIIGTQGAGLEIILKALQLTRTMCAGLSLGAADTALRLATGFALSRRLYGDTVFSLPHARATLVDAYLDLLICDATSIAAARAMHVAPEQMSTCSSIVKYVVPTISERIVENVSVVLGARHYLRKEYQSGIFQKLRRDNGLVGLFDGSTVVNLSALGLQLGHLAARRAKPSCGESTLEDRIRSRFTLGGSVPPFDPAKLDLMSHGEDDPVHALPLALRRVEDERPSGAVSGDVAAAIVEGLRGLLEELASDEKAAGLFGGRAKQATPPQLFELAKRYSLVHAAACAVHLWLHNRREGAFASGEWLALALRRVLTQFRPQLALLPRPFEDAVAEDLVRRVRERRLLSAVDLQLA